MEIRSGYARSRSADDRLPEHSDIELHYEDLGDVNDPAVLLIMGLGAQLTLWHNDFCGKIVDRGYRVVRFDNRDVGLSSKLHGQWIGGSLLPKLLKSFLGLRGVAQVFIPFGAVRPFAKLFAGGEWLSNKVGPVGSDIDAALGGGVGLQYEVSNLVGLRIDGKVIATDGPGNRFARIWEFGAGLTVRLMPVQ